MFTLLPSESLNGSPTLSLPPWLDLSTLGTPSWPFNGKCEQKLKLSAWPFNGICALILGCFTTQCCPRVLDFNF